MGAADICVAAADGEGGVVKTPILTYPAAVAVCSPRKVGGVDSARSNYVRIPPIKIGPRVAVIDKGESG